MTRVLSHTFVLALASSLQLGYAQDQPITVPAIARPAPVPLTRLIDANPPPPPVAPSLSRSANRLKTVVDIVSAAGPAFNEMMVTRAYKQQFNIELEKGLKEANRLGQRGVLVKSFVVTETVEAGQYLSLMENGATLIGVGPSANEVCVATRCDVYMHAALKPGQSFAQGYGYAFVSRKADGSFDIKNYDRVLMEDRTGQVRANEQLRFDFEQAARSTALSDYSLALSKQIRTRVDRVAIDALLKNRAEAISAVEKTEAELAKQLERARKAAQVSASLDMLANAFSLAGAINMASASMGEDVAKTSGGEITSKEGLVAAVRGIEQSTGKSVESLTVRQTTLRNQLKGYESGIVEIGIKYNMDPGSTPVFNSLQPRLP